MSQQASLVYRQSIPLAAAELATEYQLGTVTKVYNSFGAKVLFGITLTILGAIFIGVGFILSVLAGDVLTLFFSFSLPFVPAFLGLLSIISGVCIMVMARYHTGASFCVCTEGLLYIHKEQAEVVRWDEVIEVRKVFDTVMSRSEVTYFLQEYCLRLREKEEFSIKRETWNLVGGLSPSIDEYITRRLLPEIMTTYEAGIPVNFGSVEVNEQGITLHNGWRTLPWEALKQVHVQPGIVHIHKMGANNRGKPWDTIYLSGMPNPAVFVALLKNILGKKVVDKTGGVS